MVAPGIFNSHVAPVAELPFIYVKWTRIKSALIKSSVTHFFVEEQNPAYDMEPGLPAGTESHPPSMKLRILPLTWHENHPKWLPCRHTAIRTRCAKIERPRKYRCWIKVIITRESSHHHHFLHFIHGKASTAEHASSRNVLYGMPSLYHSVRLPLFPH